MESGFFLLSNSQSPYYNQSMVEHLYNFIPYGYVAMVIHSDNGSISLGQNLYYEKSGKAPISRRLTGGGAIFQGANCIGISFVADRENANIRKQSAVISLALKSLNVSCRRLDNQNIIYEDGSLACINNFDSSGPLLRQDCLLNVAQENYLKTRLPKPLNKYSVGIDSLVIALINSYQNLYKGAKEISPKALDRDKIMELAHFFESDEWLYRDKPQMPLKESYSWGNVSIDFIVENGIIKKANLFSDSPHAAFIYAIPDALYACPYLIGAIRNRILEIPFANKNMHIVRDIFRLVEQYVSHTTGNSIVKY